MRRLLYPLGITAFFASLILVARQVASLMHWDGQLVTLGVFLIIAALIWAAHAWIRHKLRQKLATLSEAERQVLAEQYETVKYAFPGPNAKSIRVTVTTGVLLVNVPTLPLMIAPLAILQYGFHPTPPLPHIGALLVGFVLAWLWWSIAVSKWRRWAVRRGMTADEAQYYGEQASMLWPRGHFLERTEWDRFVGDAKYKT
ncbi:hypothetical protein [Chitinimonas naiadis]